VPSLANAHTPGRGRLHGALAQEESLCYSTAARRARACSCADGHARHDLNRRDAMPVVAVVSCAALRRPDVAQARCRFARER
jgi:hypothetical protein